MSIKDFTTTQDNDQSSKLDTSLLFITSCCAEPAKVIFNTDRSVVVYCPNCGSRHERFVDQALPEWFLRDWMWHPDGGSVQQFYFAWKVVQALNNGWEQG